jgi:hypothetical protein
MSNDDDKLLDYYGFRKLTNHLTLVSDNSSDAPADNLFPDVDTANKWYNKNFAVVTDAGTARAYELLPNGRVSTYRTNSEFFDEQAHRKVYVPSGTDQNGNPKYKEVEAARNWFYKFGGRNSFPKSTFDPRGAPPGVFNFWPGFAISPIEGDCRLTLEYIKGVLCSGVDEHYQYLIKWCAHMVQRPWEKPEVAPCLSSEEEGTGKSKFAKILTVLIDGKDQVPYLVFSTSNPKLISGQFSGHLAHCFLLHSEEALRPESETENSIIKDLITEAHYSIHAKGKDAKAARNFLRVILSGNPTHLVQASRTSRRYFLLAVSITKMQDHTYFAAIDAELNNGGYEALMYHFLNIDISDFDVRAAPITDRLLEERTASLRGADAFWADILQTGQLNFDDTSLNRYYPDLPEDVQCETEMLSKDEGFGQKVSKIKINEYHIIKTRLFQKFAKFEGKPPYKDRSLETSFGIRFNKFFSKTSGFKLKSDKPDKYNYHILPPLKVARQCMEDFLGYKCNFDETITEWGEEPYV